MQNARIPWRSLAGFVALGGLAATATACDQALVVREIQLHRVPEIVGCRYGEVSALLARGRLAATTPAGGAPRPDDTIESQGWRPGTLLDNRANIPVTVSPGRPASVPPVRPFINAVHADVHVELQLGFKEPAQPGQRITFHANVGNRGPFPARQVSVNADSNNFEIDEVDTVGGACRHLPCLLDLAVNSTQQINLTGRALAGGLFHLSVRAGGATSDPQGDNNHAEWRGIAMALPVAPDTHKQPTSPANTPTGAAAVPVTPTPTPTPTPIPIPTPTPIPIPTSTLPPPLTPEPLPPETLPPPSAGTPVPPPAEPAPEPRGASTKPARGADVALTTLVSPPPTVRVGELVTYSLAITNFGPSAATHVRLTASLPNFTVTGVTGACESINDCVIARLARSGAENVQVSGHAAGPGALQASFEVASDPEDPDLQNNQLTMKWRAVEPPGGSGRTLAAVAAGAALLLGAGTLAHRARVRRHWQRSLTCEATIEPDAATAGASLPLAQPSMRIEAWIEFAASDSLPSLAVRKQKELT